MCTARCIVMEGSSESHWQTSDSSRGFNSSSSLDSNCRIFRTSSVQSPANTPHDSGFLFVRKAKERHVNYRTQSSGDGGLNGGPLVWTAECKDASLRQWLDNPERKVDPLECLHIFSQIVNIVHRFHSQGIVVHNVRPSCFIMSSFNRVSFIDSASDSLEYGSNREILLMESHWYSSPEEIAGGATSSASNVYQLGVLLFELFCTFGSLEEKSTTMASLRHRVLPAQMLLKWHKQASFCLWLLHPEPGSRPRMSDILQTEFLNEPRDDIEEREAAIELQEKIEEQELLLEFLLLLQKRKQAYAVSLKETISFISSDMEEVTKLHAGLMIKSKSRLDLCDNSASAHDWMNIIDGDDSDSSESRRRIKLDHYTTNPDESFDQQKCTYQESILSKSSRLMKNFCKLESAYFLARRRAIKPSPIRSNGRESNVATERSSIRQSISKEQCDDFQQSGWVNTFLEGICKYLSFSKLEVKANLKQGDLLSSSNLVSLSFDRDGEFFATAGVNKKIKVFEFNSILEEDCDIHYPVVEMFSRSKLSNVCWNGYIKSQLASSNFEGVVQVWDVTRNQIFREMKEHEQRVWSVDFSTVDPTVLASGSDDGSVKLWNINQGASIGTIKTKANVCCVQFPTDSGHSLAFGSADHKIYYYDLRNSRMPLCTLVGHNKTVSYVKFIDSTTLVSSSIDNTLKLWDLSMCGSRVLDCPLQSFSGHLNVKNFVGLSVSEGYIATGSETNEVVVYHKAFPMPAMSFSFNSMEPLSGGEVDDASQFISSVCWRGQSSTLVAANSMGNIKILEMV